MTNNLPLQWLSADGGDTADNGDDECDKLNKLHL
jgi:hypothetical protein